MPDVNTCVGGLNQTPIKAIVGRLDDTVALVISGHTHQAYNCLLPNKTGRGILVTSANAFGRVLTDIDMQIDPSSGQVVSVTANNVVVDRANETIAPNYHRRHRHQVRRARVADCEPGDRVHYRGPSQHQERSLRSACRRSDRRRAAGGYPAGSIRRVAQIALMNPGGVRVSGFVFNQSSGGRKNDVTSTGSFHRTALRQRPRGHDATAQS